MLRYALSTLQMATVASFSSSSRTTYSNIDFTRLRSILPTPVKPISIKPSVDLVREDERDDAQFYNVSRFVHHIDDRARYVLSQFYSYAIKQTPEAKTLDLCSSWTSHLPEQFVGQLLISTHDLKSASLFLRSRSCAWSRDERS